MNPVLLKPQSEVGSQVIVQGKILTTVKAKDYYKLKSKLLPYVLESFRTLCANSDLILVEGAGSAAEVNLREGDIANMGFALEMDIPVVLVGDIDRGGVIASFVGIHSLLPESEINLIKGIIVNKFRGEPDLFQSGLDVIEEKTGFTSFGIVPFFPKARFLPKEDSMALDNQDKIERVINTITIAVLRLPRIANFDDLDPLSVHTGVNMIIVEQGEVIPGNTDVIIIPGSKATLSDLAVIREQGWDLDIKAHHRRGGLIIGLCGGYQILGSFIEDPRGMEGVPGRQEGLGLLKVQTVMGGTKTLSNVKAVEVDGGGEIFGYEMHIGYTSGEDCSRPWFKLSDGRTEGACSEDRRVFGSYIHGLFASDEFRQQFLARIHDGTLSSFCYEEHIDKTLDLLADHVEKNIDLEALLNSSKSV